MITEKSMKLDDLKTGMIISKDVINKITGEVVIEKDTILNEISLIKLKTYYIEAATLSKVKESMPSHIATKYQEAETQKNEDEGILSGSIPSLAQNERQAFVDFKHSYAETESNVKQYLDAIDDGQTIVVDEIAAMTNKIMGNLKNNSSVFTYLGHLKDRNDYTYSQSINVSLLCNIFGKWINLNDDEIAALTCAGMLHDIGKSRVDPEIINKKGKLTESEFKEMQKHTIYGYEAIQSQPIREDIKLVTLQHHERIDGSGYPYGLKHKEINTFSRIVSICDVYLAMVSERPYREKICAFEVIKEFERFHFGKLDTEYLMVFLKNIAYNYLNRKVRLSNDQVGEVIFINSASYSSPIIMTDNGTAIDLLFNKDLYIKSIL